MFRGGRGGEERAAISRVDGAVSALWARFLGRARVGIDAIEKTVDVVFGESFMNEFQTEIGIDVERHLSHDLD